MILCKDCKHHVIGGDALAWCTSPENKRVVDRVNGDREEVTACVDQRAVFWGFDILNGRCGKRARWFVPRIEQASADVIRPRRRYQGRLSGIELTPVPSSKHEPDLWDVGQAAERSEPGRVAYQFLGVTGEEDA
ncbi:hypothetical protein [Paraburkholderia caribensis]|uniref:hypothetical protein n=1 Tax=Paraburkholderia caribensis TaxID=75105 RepID=UPI002857C1A9|nr:hypothetical protein [Paraburkholderia caribensis]MDR6381810.1 hypothetical protein [Paraburkholderia caribensis]